MLKKLSFDENAPWKQRFRAPTILWTQLAKAAPARGLAASNKSGVIQLYAWHVPTGELQQLTHQADGKIFGVLSPDGRYVYSREARRKMSRRACRPTRRLAWLSAAPETCSRSPRRPRRASTSTSWT